MARELSISEWCDVCFRDDIREPGENVVVTIGTGRPVEIELCKVHGQPLAELAAMLTEYGRKPEGLGRLGRPRKAPAETGGRHPSDTRDAPYVCPVCGLEFTAASVLRDHRNREDHHGPGEFRCRTCGFGYDADRGLKRHQNDTGHSGRKRSPS